jgi:hypothetical protein
MYYCKGSFLASENVQRDRIWRTASYTGNKMANWVNDIPVLMGPNLDQNDEQYLSCSPGMLVVGSPWVWHMYYVVGPAAATVMNLSLYHAKASDTAGLTWPQPDRAELRIRRGVPPNYTYTLFSDFLVEQCPIVGGQNCFIENPTPIKVGNNIDLYFIGQLHDGNRKLYRMQGISSSNYIDFTEPQPVYTPANMAGMSSGHVTYYNNMYYFVYAGNTAHYGEPTRIDLATCNPSWVCSVETIMSAGTGTWDLDHKFSPFLFVDGTKFSVYYAGNIDPTDPNWFWGALSTIGIRQYNIP